MGRVGAGSPKPCQRSNVAVFRTTTNDGAGSEIVSDSTCTTCARNVRASGPVIKKFLELRAHDMKCVAWWAFDCSVYCMALCP